MTRRWSRFSGKDRCSPGPDGTGTGRQLDPSLADLPLISAEAPPLLASGVWHVFWCQQYFGRAQGEQAGCPAVLHLDRQLLMNTTEEA